MWGKRRCRARTAWLIRPSLIVWVTLEHDIEEDDKVGDRQASQGNVVQGNESRSRRSKTLVEEDEGELDGPERGNVESRPRDNHLHDALEVLWRYCRHVTKS